MVTWSHACDGRLIHRCIVQVFHISAAKQEFPNQLFFKYLAPDVEKQFQDKVITDSGHQRAITTQNSVEKSQTRDFDIPDSKPKCNKQVSMDFTSSPKVIPSVEMRNQLRGVCVCVHVYACVHACVRVCVHVCVCVSVLSYVHVRRYVGICVCNI